MVFFHDIFFCSYSQFRIFHAVSRRMKNECSLIRRQRRPWQTKKMCRADALQHYFHLPSAFEFLPPPPPVKLIEFADAVGGFFHPRQLLQRLSGSELQLQRESSSNLSESSKLKRSPSSQSSIAAATSPLPGKLLPTAPATFVGIERKDQPPENSTLTHNPEGQSP